MPLTEPPAPRLKIYAHPSEFMTDCAAFLYAREAENNLMLRIMCILAKPEYPYREFYLASGGQEEIDGAFVMTPPLGLILSSPASRTAIALVIENLLSIRPGLAGVIGRSDLGDQFAEMWTEKTGKRADISTHLYLYQISHIANIPIAKGQWRRATLDDLEFMLTWARAFDNDAHEIHDPDRTRISMTNEISEGDFYIWEDGRPVSMVRAASTSPTAKGISAVYTPPEFRNRGYASSLVWAVSRLMLQSGKTFCFLFTNARNPTSNNIYQRIGYEKLCDFHKYAFSEK
jgi:predicted GNAT family acetyltransferase